MRREAVLDFVMIKDRAISHKKIDFRNLKAKLFILHNYYIKHITLIKILSRDIKYIDISYLKFKLTTISKIFNYK